TMRRMEPRSPPSWRPSNVEHAHDRLAGRTVPMVLSRAMKLYWHPFSIIPRRVRIAFREKGIPCDEVEVDLPGGAPRGPEFRRVNPFAQVPVLEDGDLIVSESVAILEYLEERFPTPALLP